MHATWFVVLAVLLPTAPPAVRAAEATGARAAVSPANPGSRRPASTTAALASNKPTSRPAGQATLLHCQVLLLEDVEVPAQEAGALLAMNVKEGDFVQQGQLLGQIDDRQAQLQKEAALLERSVAQAKADDDIEVRYAQKSFELRRPSCSGTSTSTASRRGRFPQATCIGHSWLYTEPNCRSTAAASTGRWLR